MNDITRDMRRDLEMFNRKHAAALQKTAQKLLERDIVRVHYGVDYVNDDGDPADYAVLEYSDGRTEERCVWLEDLDYKTFSGMRYCYPYTFDARTNQISFDLSGGQIDTEENVIRMFHTEQRREMLEDEAEGNNRLMDFIFAHREALRIIGNQLEEHGISDVHFGVDETPLGYALSDWAFAAKEDGSDERPLDELPEVMKDFLSAMTDFPLEVGLIGAFSLNASTCWVYHDADGGLHYAEDGTVRAYHTAAQLEALQGL